MNTQATGTAAAPTWTVDIVWKDEEIQVNVKKTDGEYATCKVDRKALDLIALDDDEDGEYKRVQKEGKGRGWFQTSMTKLQMELWASMKKKASAPPALPSAVQPSAPEVSQTPTQPVCVAPGTPVAIVESANGMVTTVVQFPNHVVTVEHPADYQGGTKKKRVRKTDPDIVALYEDISGYCRAVGLNEMEARIAQLEKAKAFVSGKVKRMTYDIPSKVRAEIIEPTKVLRCIGPMPTESEVYGRDESFERGIFIRFLNVLKRYGKGTENHKRLGCYAKWRIAGIAFEDVNDLRETVSEALDEKLIEAHTRLINGLADADAELVEAMKGEPTEKEQENANCAWANEYRARIRAAHEELNIALQSADQFDLNMDTVDLLRGLRATVASRRNSFNAQAAARRLKGVEI